MARTLGVVIAVMLSMAVCGCGSRTRVMVPPRIDLTQHEVIGIIDFNCDGEYELGPFATGRFVEAARQDQGIVRVVRLGPEDEVLKAIGHAQLDAAAFKALGEKHGLKTIIMGDLTMSEVRPSVRVLHSLTRVGVSADVAATLAVQMVETASGASIWSRSASDTQHVGGASFSGNKDVVFDVRDPEETCGQLVDSLVYAVTPEFRVTWERR